MIHMSRLVDKALEFASKKHEGQLDDSGRPYFFAHVVQVHGILQDVSDDEEVLCAGLLHDIIEDTDTTYEELVHEFTKEIADIVLEVTHVGNSVDNYYFPLLRSRKAIMVQFADRLSNMARMVDWPGNVQQSFLEGSMFWRSKPP